MEPEDQIPAEDGTLRELKHDIKNELSGMILCLEQLRYEIQNPPPDWEYYMDAIGNGFTNIIKRLDAEK